MVILAINPGSTSTKVSLWSANRWLKASLPWQQPTMPLDQQAALRMDQVVAWLREQNTSVTEVSCVVARGGLLKPLRSGTYTIDAAMVHDAEQGERGLHPSNLGPILGKRLADEAGVTGYIVDPVSVDERLELARFTGFPALERQGFGHILNLRAAARRAAGDLGKPLTQCRLAMAHLGGGVSVAAVDGGRILDINNANDEGPFSAERAGGLPFGSVIDLCFADGALENTVLQMVLKESGFQGYLGTMDLQEVEAMNTPRSQDVWNAFVYQVVKDIGAYTTVLQGRIDAVVLTGGMMHSTALAKAITDRIQWCAPVLCYPGEEEMEALTAGATRVLLGEEQAKHYAEEVV